MKYIFSPRIWGKGYLACTNKYLYTCTYTYMCFYISYVLVVTVYVSTGGTLKIKK